MIIYDSMFQRIARKPNDRKAYAQDLPALRIGVARAIRRTSVVTAKGDPHPFLEIRQFAAPIEFRSLLDLTM